jgi:hypothetical protein
MIKSIIMVFLFIIPQFTFGQNIQLHSDSCSLKYSVDSSDIASREVNIIVSPQEVSNATITIIKNGAIENQPSYTVITSIIPDTIGVCRAPLSIYLTLGRYEFIANKDGYRNAMKEIEINRKIKYGISLKMDSFEYLQQKREQWGTYKWISAAIAVGAGIATYYCKDRIDKYKDEYNNATSIISAKEKRVTVEDYQRYYTLSSATTLTFIGGFGISWLIQSIY